MWNAMRSVRSWVPNCSAKPKERPMRVRECKLKCVRVLSFWFRLIVVVLVVAHVKNSKWNGLVVWWGRRKSVGFDSLGRRMSTSLCVCVSWNACCANSTILLLCCSVYSAYVWHCDRDDSVNVDVNAVLHAVVCFTHTHTPHSQPFSPLACEWILQQNFDVRPLIWRVVSVEQQWKKWNKINMMSATVTVGGPSTHTHTLYTYVIKMLLLSLLFKFYLLHKNGSQKPEPKKEGSRQSGWHFPRPFAPSGNAVDKLGPSCEDNNNNRRSRNHQQPQQNTTILQKEYKMKTFA